MKRNLKTIIREKNPGVFLLLRTIRRMIKKDDCYLQRALALGDSANCDYLELLHNGTKDYGKTIYVITENSPNEGFCATLRFIIWLIIFAQQHGFAPVIRLSKDFAYYDKDMRTKCSNPWEYYFLSSEESFDENIALNVCYSRYYHMMTMKEYSALDAYSLKNYYNRQAFRICSPIINKYMRLKPEIIKESSALLEKEKNGKILGVHFRGTDYKNCNNDHPVFIDEDRMISEIDKALEATGLSTVFLATDDAAFPSRIKSSFRNIRFLQHPDVFRSNGNTSVAFSKSSRKYHKYLLGYEIARDMYTLSLCDGLVAGKSSVSFMSNLYKHSRNEEYEYMKIIDNGNNKNDNEFIRPTGDR